MSLHGPDRMARVSALLKEKISNIFLRDVNDPGIGMITITDVSVGADLRNATIYYSVLGDDARRKYTWDYIQQNAGMIGRLLGANIELRYTPRLTFRYDSTPERATHVLEILEKIERERREREAALAAAAPPFVPAADSGSPARNVKKRKSAGKKSVAAKNKSSRKPVHAPGKSKKRRRS